MNGNGVRLPSWSIAILVGLLLQLAVFVATFATLRNDVAHLAKTLEETRFRTENMGDGEKELRERVVRLEARLEAMERGD